MKQKTAIIPTREENFPQWFQQVVKEADLAEHSSVRGCMIIKPWGYRIWELLQKDLDARIKKQGVQNAYFPLFIPLSFFEKEAQHVEGFAKECAVVTHHRLEKNDKGKLAPSSPLEEPFIVRPTSEMIIGDAFSKWIQSYRDLPLKINQWANVVRWEMRTRLFLRTTEFLWQEGHTAHALREEALEQAMRSLEIYCTFVEETLALFPCKGKKTEREKFPGAVTTYTFELMMQDGKALQGGTSHFLGQNFAQSNQIRFQTPEGDLEHVWTTSWGITTRLVGALVMAHSDDHGLVLPPKVAPIHVVIIPILFNVEDSERKVVEDYCLELQAKLQDLFLYQEPLVVHIDQRDLRVGEKKWQWIKKGVPIRIEIGAKECTEGKISYFLRTDAEKREKSSVHSFVKETISFLEKMQQTLLANQKTFCQKHQKRLSSKEEFYQFFSEEKEKGFVVIPYQESEKLEKQLQEELGVTARCTLLEEIPATPCIFSGEEVHHLTVFGKAY